MPQAEARLAVAGSGARGRRLFAKLHGGDRYSDIEAGHSEGCRTILIGNGYREAFKARPDATVRTLTEAADWILKQSEKKD